MVVLVVGMVVMLVVLVMVLVVVVMLVVEIWWLQPAAVGCLKRGGSCLGGLTSLNAPKS